MGVSWREAARKSGPGRLDCSHIVHRTGGGSWKEEWRQLRGCGTAIDVLSPLTSQPLNLIYSSILTSVALHSSFSRVAKSTCLRLAIDCRRPKIFCSVRFTVHALRSAVSLLLALSQQLLAPYSLHSFTDSSEAQKGCFRAWGNLGSSLAAAAAVRTLD